MKSFDEYFKERHEKTGLYVDSLCGRGDATYLKHEMKNAYLNGQLSREDEVDGLRGYCASTLRSKDELQKRIDEALKFASDAHSDFNIGMLKMVNILRGEK